MRFPSTHKSTHRSFTRHTHQFLAGLVCLLLPAGLLFAWFQAASARQEAESVRLINLTEQQEKLPTLARLAGQSGRIAAVRESRGGFLAGESFLGLDAAGAVARVSPEGRQASGPWATLSGEAGLVRGLYADADAGELIAVTTEGGIWRIDAAGNAWRVSAVVSERSGEGAESPVAFEDVTLTPNDWTRYGPWAGKILAVSRDRSAVYAIAASGAVERFDLGIPRGNNIRLIPAGENFFGATRAPGGRTSLYGVAASDFAGMAGDLLITQAGGEACGCRPALWRVRWDGAEFQKTKLAGVDEREAEWGRITFSRLGAELLQQQGVIPLVGPTGRPAAVGADDLMRQEVFIPAANGLTTVAFTVSDSQALRFINTLFNNGDAEGFIDISASTIPANFTVSGSGDSGATFGILNNNNMGSVRTNTPVKPRMEERNIDIRITVPAGTPVDRDYDLIIQVTSATDATKFDRTTDRLRITAAASAQCTVGPATLPGGTTGTAYSQTLTAAGATAPIAFSVSAGALPPGLALNAATGQLSGTPTTAGTYMFTISATGANGLTCTRAYEVGIITPPVQCTPPAITVQPADRTVCGGTSAFFNVTATGTSLGYQWRKDGVNIPGATGSQFVIVQVTLADPAKYDVVVSNACGMATSTASQLSIAPASAITTQPASQTRLEGAGVTFSVTAANAVSYQWRKNGANIPGATASSYTIAAVAPGDAGNYDVVVSGGCGAITSAAAVLTVTQCPAITIAPAANALPPAVVGTSYSQTFMTSGGVAPVTLSLSGSLPAGFSFNPATGVLAGTTAATGVFAFTITARDATGCARSQNYSLAVGQTLASCRLTICFRSARYFSLNWGTYNIPNGAVLVDGVNFGAPLTSTDARVRQALDGQFGALNREWVAAQLNILAASGVGAANVQTAFWSELHCYGLDFDPVVVGGSAPFTRNTLFFDLVQYINAAVKRGVSGRDACVLTKILNGLNGDSNRNVCHRSTAKIDFSSCN